MEFSKLAHRVLSQRLSHTFSEIEREEIVEAAAAKMLDAYFDIDDKGRARLYRTVIFNTAVDYLRKKRTRDRMLREYASQMAGHHAEDATSSIAKQEIRSLLGRTLVEDLTPVESKIIYARYYCNQRMEEISTDLGMPVSTAYAKLNAALQKLARKLAAYRDILD